MNLPGPGRVQQPARAARSAAQRPARAVAAGTAAVRITERVVTERPAEFSPGPGPGDGASTSSPVVFVGRQHTGNLTERGLETIRSLDDWATNTLSRHLRNSDTCWQPHDFLPDASSDGFLDQVIIGGRACLGFRFCPGGH
jgi:hypothetical protein